ncbi:P2Y purinoceptor 1-like [Syngnathus typhle]|uniref:P2Y purinoceptor 1-like n=1 Tax=Syngnathus typhle TaxID=161592 RepID=UPI002A6A35C0|nr:P2Y purinoceptor 1-like [Syngnathus typhle]
MNSSGPFASPLWYQYQMCAVAPYGFVFYYGVKVFNLVVGTPCNGLVIWQIAAKKSDACTSDVFIISLAVLDAYFCLMVPTELLNSLLLDDARIWYLQRFSYGVKDLGVLFLVCVCVDRHMAVVHPVLFASNQNNKIRTGISVATWAVIMPYALAKCILGSRSVNGVFSCVVLFAFAVMVLCNISVIWVLRRSVAGKEVMHPAKKRALKMVLTVLAIIVVNYLPPVLMPFASYYSLMEFTCQIRISVYSIMDLSCSVEPLLYITKMECVGGRGCGCCVARTPHCINV